MALTLDLGIDQRSIICLTLPAVAEFLKYLSSGLIGTADAQP
ncbi:hypothetical protein [Hoyosella altamirensis]|uniref:Uncharacterized protein n=1 Tax=Hoyosella altamirensis TaxID=616997 RepID=A0A839RN65_9ACTN|nr:hypothetical protein [Hoyosella altamirensis]MBB3037371.1 hypothetical protein [Hoyosella altamirensis]